MYLKYKRRIRPKLFVNSDQVPQKSQEECLHIIGQLSILANEKIENSLFQDAVNCYIEIMETIQLCTCISVDFIRQISLFPGLFKLVQSNIDLIEFLADVFIVLIQNNFDFAHCLISDSVFQFILSENNYPKKAIQQLFVLLISHDQSFSKILVDQFELCQKMVDPIETPLFYSRYLYTCDPNDITAITTSISFIIQDIHLIDDEQHFQQRINSLTHIVSANQCVGALILDDPTFNNFIFILQNPKPMQILKATLSFFRVFINSSEEILINKFLRKVHISLIIPFIFSDNDEISKTAIILTSDIIAEKFYPIDVYLQIDLPNIISRIFINGTFTQKKFAIYCLINLSLYYKNEKGNFEMFMPKDEALDNFFDIIISNDYLNDEDCIYGIRHIFQLVELNMLFQSSMFDDFYIYLQDTLLSVSNRDFVLPLQSLIEEISSSMKLENE